MSAERAPRKRDQVEAATLSEIDLEAIADQELLEEIAEAELKAEQKAGDRAIGLLGRAVNPMMAGYFPQIAGAATKATAEIGELFGAQPAKSYTEYRDEAAKLLSSDTGAPRSETAAQIAGLAGSLASGAAIAKGLSKIPGAAKALSIGGEGVLSTAAKGAALGAGSAFLANPGDIEGQVSLGQIDERLRAMTPGALFGAGIGAIGGMAAAPAKLAGRFQQIDEITPKEFAAIEAAATRQNVPATLGTFTNQKLPRQLEVMLGEMPVTGHGQRVGQERMAMYQGMQQAIAQGTSKRATQDKAFVGQSMREQLNKMVDRIYEPIAKKYSQIMPELEIASVNEKTLDKSMDFYDRMIDRSSSILRDGPQAKAIKGWIQQIRSARNARDLDNSQTGLFQLSNEFQRSGAGVPKELSALMDGVERQKRRAIVEAALEAQGGRTVQQLKIPGIKMTGRERESRDLAETLVKDLKATDKEYSQFIESLENVGVKRGKVTRGTFMRALDSLSDEDIYNKLSKVNDRRFWDKLSVDAPEVVELLQSRMMADLVEKSIPSGGSINEISVQKFINAVEDFRKKSPTLYRVVFEAQSPAQLQSRFQLPVQPVGQMIQDIGLLSRRMPNIGEVNPSRTGLASETIDQAKSFWSPRSQIGAGAMNYLYRNLMTPQTIGEAVGRASRGPSISAGMGSGMNNAVISGPKIEGVPEGYLRQVPEVEVPLLLEQISKDQGLRVTEKAQYSNLVNKHRKIPQNYLMVPQ